MLAFRFHNKDHSVDFCVVGEAMEASGHDVPRYLIQNPQAAPAFLESLFGEISHRLTQLSEDGIKAGERMSKNGDFEMLGKVTERLVNLLAVSKKFTRITSAEGGTYLSCYDLTPLVDAEVRAKAGTSGEKALVAQRVIPYLSEDERQFTIAYDASKGPGRIKAMLMGADEGAAAAKMDEGKPVTSLDALIERGDG